MTKYSLIFLLFGQFFLNGNSYAVTQKIINNQEKVGLLVRQTNLLKSAKPDSEVITVLKASENITIKSRQRAWYYISPINIPDYSTNKISKGTPLFGWVSMLNVRFLAQAKREGELGLSAAFSSMSKGTLPTVSTGVRGFDDNDLKNSQADFKQVERLHTYKVSKESAKMFAQSVNLLKKVIIKEQGK